MNIASKTAQLAILVTALFSTNCGRYQSDVIPPPPSNSPEASAKEHAATGETNTNADVCRADNPERAALVAKLKTEITAATAAGSLDTLKSSLARWRDLQPPAPVTTIVDDDGLTILGIAIKFKYLDLIEFLMDEYPELNPLQHASQHDESIRAEIKSILTGDVIDIDFLNQQLLTTIEDVATHAYKEGTVTEQNSRALKKLENRLAQGADPSFGYVYKLENTDYILSGVYLALGLVLNENSLPELEKHHPNYELAAALVCAGANLEEPFGMKKFGKSIVIASPVELVTGSSSENFALRSLAKGLVENMAAFGPQDNSVASWQRLLDPSINKENKEACMAKPGP